MGHRTLDYLLHPPKGLGVRHHFKITRRKLSVFVHDVAYPFLSVVLNTSNCTIDKHLRWRSEIGEGSCWLNLSAEEYRKLQER